MRTLTAPEREAFLADLHVGVLAVERKDRAPLAVPIWYTYEPGGEIALWTGAESVKAKLIRAAGRFSFTAQSERPPYAYVTAEGPVTGIEEATREQVLPIAVRYLGEEIGAGFVEQEFGEGSVIIKMRPERWLSSTGAE